MKVLALAALLGSISAVDMAKKHHHKHHQQSPHNEMVEFENDQEALNPYNVPELIDAKVHEEVVTPHMLAAAEDNDDDTNKTPEIDFARRYDQVGYSNEEIAAVRDAVKITKTKTAKGRYCGLNEFAVVWYQGWDEAGSIRFDNKKLGVTSRPKVFKIGNYQVSKCWDVAIQQMKVGEIAKFRCPGEFDKGGAADQYTHFGSGWIPENTDMTYVIEVDECSIDPKYFQPIPLKNAPFGAEIKKDTPYYLRALGLNKYGKEMVLDVAHEDKYAPLKTGVYNVYLNEKKVGEKSQMFSYSTEDDEFYNAFLPGFALMEGYNNNLVMYYDKNFSRQKFIYNRNHKHIINNDTKNIGSVKKENGEMDHTANIITIKDSIEYSNVFELDSA